MNVGETGSVACRLHRMLIQQSRVFGPVTLMTNEDLSTIYRLLQGKMSAPFLSEKSFSRRHPADNLPGSTTTSKALMAQFLYIFPRKPSHEGY